MAIAHAEKAEQAATEKVKDRIDEAEKRVQRAEESAVQLAQKFTDTMKRMEGSTSIGMRQQLNQELEVDTHTQNEWRLLMPRRQNRQPLRKSKTVLMR